MSLSRRTIYSESPYNRSNRPAQSELGESETRGSHLCAFFDDSAPGRSYMAKAWNKTRVSHKLGIDYPIIQGPLGGFSSQRLTAAVSNFGGLGSFGAHSLEPSAIAEVIGEVRSLTTKPFAMNLWVSMEDPGAATSDAAAFHRAASHLRPHIEALGGAQPAFTPYKAIRFENQARVLLDARVPVFSFIFGIPPQEIVEEARRLGIVTIGTAT